MYKIVLKCTHVHTVHACTLEGTRVYKSVSVHVYQQHRRVHYSFHYIATQCTPECTSHPLPHHAPHTRTLHPAPCTLYTNAKNLTQTKQCTLEYTSHPLPHHAPHTAPCIPQHAPHIQIGKSLHKEGRFSKCTWQLLIAPYMLTLHPAQSTQYTNTKILTQRATSEKCTSQLLITPYIRTLPRHPHPALLTMHPIYKYENPNTKKKASVSAHNNVYVRILISTAAPYTPHNEPHIQKRKSGHKEGSFSKCTWQLCMCAIYSPQMHPAPRTWTSYTKTKILIQRRQLQ